MRRPGRRLPGLPVAHWNHVDMTIEDQRALALLSECAGDQHRFGPLHFHARKAGMRFQQIDVGLEAVDLETRLLEHEGDEILDRAFVTRDGGHPHQVLRQPNAGIGIERL